MVQSKYWCFTINNPTENDFQAVDNVGNDKRVEYQICNYEEGEEGTPHLQGYTCFFNKIRDTTVRKLIPGNVDSRMKKATHNDNVHYCSKPHESCECKHCQKIWDGKGKRISGPYVWGDDKDIPKDTSEQGERNDFKAILSRIDEGALLSDLRNEFPSQYFRYKKMMVEEIELKRQSDYKKEQIEDLKEFEVLEWHQQIIDEVEDQNRREIIFVVDFQGNQNKSHFGKYLRTFHDYGYYKIGKKADFAQVFRKNIKKKLVIDLPRGMQEYSEYIYTVLEDLKDGELQAPKFDSEHLSFSYCKIVMLMNSIPNVKGLSDDRSVVYKLDNGVLKLMDNERLKKGLIN